MSVATINYNKTNWASGQIITQQGLNNIESGISDAVNKITDIVNLLNGLNNSQMNNQSQLYTIASITQSDGYVSATFQPIQTSTTSQSGVVTLTNTLNSSDESHAITPKGVSNAINALDVNNEIAGNGNHITGFGADKTLASLTKENGIMKATFQNITIPMSQISDLPSLGAAAEKEIDTTITNTTSTNIPTTSAIVTYINNNVSGAASGVTYRGIQGTVPPLEGTFNAGDMMLKASTQDLYIYDNANNGTWYKVGQDITFGTGLTTSGDNTNSLSVSLDIASTNDLGGIKVGTNLSIDANGVLSATDTTYEYATASVAGLIKVGANLSISEGVLSAVNTSYDYASASVAGIVKIGSHVSIDQNGYLSASFNNVTSSQDGLMSSTDKIKLDDIPSMPSEPGLYFLRVALVDDELVYNWEELTNAEDIEV